MIELPRFNDVIDPKLRAWNRLNVIYNLKEMANNKTAVRYSEKFSKKDKFNILQLSTKIANDGYENVRREILRTRNSH